MTEAQRCQQQLRASVPGWARGSKTSATRPFPCAKIGGVMALPRGSPRLVGAPLGVPRGWTRAGLGDRGTARSCSAGTAAAGRRAQGARPVLGPELRNGVSGGAPENTPYLWGQEMSLNVCSCDFRGGFSVLVSVVWQTLAGCTGWHKNTKCVLAVVRSEMLVKHCGLSQKCLKITLGYQSTAGSAAASRARQLGELSSRNVCAPAGVVLAVPALPHRDTAAAPLGAHDEY